MGACRWCLLRAEVDEAPVAFVGHGGEAEPLGLHGGHDPASVGGENAGKDEVALGPHNGAEGRRQADVGIGADVGQDEFVAAFVSHGEHAGADSDFGADAVLVAVPAGDPGCDGVNVNGGDAGDAEFDGRDGEHAGTGADIEHGDTGAGEGVEGGEAKTGGLVVAGAERLSGIEADGNLAGANLVLDPGGDDDCTAAGIDDAEKLAPGNGPVLFEDGAGSEFDGGVRLHGTAEALGEDCGQLGAGQVGADEDGLAAADTEAHFGAENVHRFLNGDASEGDDADQVADLLNHLAQ